MIKNIISIGIIGILMISSTIPAKSVYAEDQNIDSVAPVITIPDKFVVFVGMSGNKLDKFIKSQIKVMDDADGDISSKVTYKIYPSLNEVNDGLISISVKDAAGNSKTASAWIYVVENSTGFTGLQPLTVATGEKIDLTEGVHAFDKQFNEVAFTIDSVKEVLNSSSEKRNQVELHKLDGNTYITTQQQLKSSSYYEVKYSYTDEMDTKHTALRYINVAPENTDSEIMSLRLGQSIVAPGKTLQLEADVTNQSKINYILVSYKTEGTYLELSDVLYYHEKLGKFVGSIEIPTGYENKQWNIKYIHVNYTNGQYLNYELNTEMKKSNFIVFNGSDKEKPTIQLPSTDLKVELNSAVNLMDGVTAYDIPDGNLSDQIKLDGKVDFSKIGNYPLIYRVQDAAGNITEVERKVTVVDSIFPTITVKNSKLTAYVQQGEQAIEDLLMSNASATDNYDGDLKSKIQINNKIDFTTPGLKTVIYTVMDSSNNKVEEKVQLQLLDYPEKHTVKGSEDLIIVKGSSFDPLADYSVVDTFGKTEAIRFEGQVNTNQVGDYTLKYTSTDLIGRTSVHNRVIHVREKSKPYFKIDGDLVVKQGDSIDPHQGVKAYDMFGKSLETSGYGSFDSSKAGTYTYNYVAVDAFNQKVTAERKIIVKASNNEQAFHDVPINHPYYQEIMTLKNANIISGYPNGNFGTKDAIYRKHVVALIYRSGIDLTPIRAAKQFKDVPTTDTSYNEIQALYRAGIIDGTGDMFYPNKTLTREELARILVDAFKLENKGGYENFFKDVKPSSWSYPYITTLASHGITVGSYGNYMPKDTVQRQYYAVFMFRSLGYSK